MKSLVLIDGKNVDKIDEKLFHYTSYTALENIFGKGELWMSNANFLNDKSEFSLTSEASYGIGLLKSIKKEYESSGTPIRNKIVRLIQTFFDDDSLNKLYEVYVFSFSTQFNSLSQWRGYADQGCNFSVYPEALINLLKNNEGLKLGKCLYDKNEHREVLIDYISRYPEGDEFTKSVDDAKILREDFFSILPLLKHSDFAQEQEYRLVLSLFSPDIPKHKLIIRPKANLLVPYYALQMEGNAPPQSITIGPHTNQKLAKKGVETFLASRYGSSVGIEIEVSKTPYRPL